MRRLAAAFADEGAAIFGLGFLLALPHELYADVCYQLVDGRAIWHGAFPVTVPMAIAAGPLVDHEWLFEALAWPFWQVGLFPIFVVFCVAAAAATPLLARAIARACGATPWTANAVGYLSLCGTVTSYAVRPQTFAVLAFALVLRLALGPLARPWALGAIVVVWANLHGSATFAPALVALVFGARVVAGASSEQRARLAQATVWAALGTLVTPLGPRLYAGAAQYGAAVLQTADWRPLSLAYPIEFVALALYGFVLISGGVAVTRANAVALTLLAAFGGLWFELVRFLPFFTIAAVPAFAHALGPDGAAQGRRARPARPLAGGRPVSGLLLGVPIVVALGLAAVLLAPLALRPNAGAAAADALVRESGFRGPLFVPYEAAAYLELREDPVRVLIDSHATPFPEDVWADYRTIDGAAVGWDAALARRGIAGAVAGDDSALAAAFAESGAWRRCAARPGYTLYVTGAAARNRTPRCRG